MHGALAAFALAALRLFVGKHGVAGRAPIDRRLLAVCKPLLVKLQKHPLRPLVIVGAAGDHLAAPVEHCAHCAQLLLHGGNIFFRGIVRMHSGFDGIIFRGQPERVKAHGLKHVETLHTLKARKGIGRPVIIPVPGVELCARRIGEHLQHIVFFAGVIRAECVNSALLPAFLPLLLDFCHVHRLLFPVKQ